MKKLLMIFLALALLLSSCQLDNKNSLNITSKITAKHAASSEKSDLNIEKNKDTVSVEKWKWDFKDNHISLDNLQLYKSVDSGKSWNKISIPMDKIPKESYTDAESIVPYFLGDIGWVSWIVPPTLYTLKTTDGGLHWKKLSFEIEQLGEDIAALQFITADEGWVLTVLHGAGMQINYLLKTDNGGTSWKEIKITSDKNYTGLYSSGNYSNMIFYGRYNGWITVSNSTSSETVTYKTSDGGKTWSKVLLPVPKSYKKYYVMSANVPVLVGVKNYTFTVEYRGLSNNKTVKHAITYKSNDGGNKWEIAHID
ncbi:hypothetical protein Thexy_1705 [Thermoanaerobacterium xylanolyticum LX-11]|uniref:Photosynthesis system II assembly factor Ycf48/Hcf136-like domain-containing protein n=1 Tax=Thermoanaerobacterium xylanolyticum (strain ATCC 49914 / DSM 7097 / LX-11) TaxID=858215 RepID=F6BI59_THEXL|nr:hypothetical protein [Thermoanaerobacterium xylanolyticum]AEF17733.1 hypothetical protein Thexy_1705 [Thermoanaerobacterium xylanolyticum LX-11]